MKNSILIAKGKNELNLSARVANRHGLIAGATGTGKTVTLRVLAEGFSELGVPVFIADVKGDLSGIAQVGGSDPKIIDRARNLGITDFGGCSYPVTFWDMFGEKGHPLRTTISEMGPFLLGRLLELNETQTGVLSIIFKVADEQGLLLLDLNDLRAVLQYVGENAKEFTVQYGNVTSASVGAIQRSLLTLSEQGGNNFFGEPALDIMEFVRTTSDGKGMINLLAADRLMSSPLLYSTFLLWLLSELFERMPEVGDLEKPKLVFFFDEAHLLFDEAPKALLERIQQVIRLIRSKGVGVYFISQSPLDVDQEVLGQLGNKIQHAIRAFTPKDQKALKTMVDTFRSDKSFDVGNALPELQIGEALISLLDEAGIPGYVERAMIVPPRSRLSPLSPEERKSVISNSIFYGRYENVVDRESAYEKLSKRAEQNASAEQSCKAETTKVAKASTRQSPLEAFVVSTARSVGSQFGRQIFRGILGSILGKSK